MRHCKSRKSCCAPPKHKKQCPLMRRLSWAKAHRTTCRPAALQAFGIPVAGETICAPSTWLGLAQAACPARSCWSWSTLACSTAPQKACTSSSPTARERMCCRWAPHWSRATRGAFSRVGTRPSTRQAGALGSVTFPARGAASASRPSPRSCRSRGAPRPWPSKRRPSCCRLTAWVSFAAPSCRTPCCPRGPAAQHLRCTGCRKAGRRRRPGVAPSPLLGSPRPSPSSRASSPRRPMASGSSTSWPCGTTEAWDSRTWVAFPSERSLFWRML
mmetsp:Transcript_89070/g.288459  ORF Transcript_89070/g.288459 Transcript_89070/m.288459 type:complete len:272 (+) Transcript_89070:444-1259(+)